MPIPPWVGASTCECSASARVLFQRCARLGGEHLGDQGTVHGFAQFERLIGVAAHGNLFDARADRLPAVGCARRLAVGGQFFDDGDVHGLHSRRRPPGDPVVAAPDDAGQAGDARAGGVEFGAVEMDKVGVGGSDGGEMGIAGEDRSAADGVFSGDSPVVARAAVDAEELAELCCGFA